MKKYAMPWRSVFLAPLASVPVVTILGLGSSDAGIASDLGWGVFFGFLFAVPASFLALVLFGLPAYFLLRRFDCLSLWTVCAIGALVPFALLFEDLPWGTTLAAVASGIAVAAAAYVMRPELNADR